MLLVNWHRNPTATRTTVIRITVTRHAVNQARVVHPAQLPWAAAIMQSIVDVHYSRKALFEFLGRMLGLRPSKLLATRNYGSFASVDDDRWIGQRNNLAPINPNSHYIGSQSLIADIACLLVLSVNADMTAINMELTGMKKTYCKTSRFL